MSKQASKHKSRRFRHFLRTNKAVSALEYAILVGVIAVAIGGAIAAFSDQIEAAMTAIGANVASVTTPAGGTIGATPP